MRCINKDNDKPLERSLGSCCGYLSHGNCNGQYPLCPDQPGGCHGCTRCECGPGGAEGRHILASYAVCLMVTAHILTGDGRQQPGAETSLQLARIAGAAVADQSNTEADSGSHGQPEAFSGEETRMPRLLRTCNRDRRRKIGRRYGSDADAGSATPSFSWPRNNGGVIWNRKSH